MIRPCTQDDLPVVHAIVNEAALKYRGVIPAHCWHDPYMPWDELLQEVAAGVRFWGWDEDGTLVGVMGLQNVRDATLIRHAYVRPGRQGGGIGKALLEALVESATGTLLVGTWAAASWAIALYERHGFRLVEQPEKDRLLDRYWTISRAQRDASVVLAHSSAVRGS